MGWILATVLTVSAGHDIAIGDEPRLADYFGFLPLEVYKLDPRVGNLILKDLDGDKTDDIVVVNNGRSRIDLLLSSKKGDEDKTAPVGDEEPNQIASDRRMRLVSVPVNKEVVSLQVADFDGDGRPDLAFFGNPAEIVIMLNDGQGLLECQTAQRGGGRRELERVDRRRPQPGRSCRPRLAPSE